MTTSDLDLLNVQARWLAERYERISEGFSTRAGVLLGLLAVELGVLGQINAQPYMLTIAVVALLGCGVPFVLTLSTKAVLFPEASYLLGAASAVATDPDHESLAAPRSITEQLLQPVAPSDSVVEQFKVESQDRAKWFRRGLIAFGVAQVLVAITILNGAFDARNTGSVPNDRARDSCCRADRVDGGPHSSHP